MSDIIIAVFLGTVQGLTEFLPVSSSGHLALLQNFFGPEWTENLLFDVCVHMGTMLAVLVFFYKDLLKLLLGILPGSFDKQQAKVVLALLITTVITGVIGVGFQDQFEGLYRMPRFVACMLLITGCITFATDRIGKSERQEGEITYKDAVIVGLFQSLAIIPGISRSGSTIFAGVFSGMERTWAASYSFIAAIPAILGATLLQIGESGGQLGMIHIVGSLTAFIVGLISLKFLVWTLKKHNFFIFSIYCWIAGTGYLVFSIF